MSRPSKALFCFSLLSAVLPAVLAGCSSDTKSAAAVTPISDHYRHLGDNLGQTIAGAKSSATTAGSVVPADFGSVAHVPKETTGSVDITTAQTGKTGDTTANVDGVGATENISIFVPDVKTGNGTSATLPSFVAWKGDDGLCYLGFSKGTSYFVVSKCGDASGAWVCNVTSSDATCNACNLTGDCKPCDMTQGTLTCTW